MKWRHEIKHVIGRTDHILLRNRLRAILTPDQKADAHGTYRVRSLYYDDLFDSALKDKINGVDRREKFRIRCYNADFNFIRLEKKIKSAGMCAKRSARLSREETSLLLQGDIDFLLKREDDLLTEFYSKLKGRLLQPRTIVEYAREPFVHAAGNTRITLDSDIRTGLCDRDFFRTDPLRLPADDNYTVLEIKYDQFLPELVQKALQMGFSRSVAISKYALSRRFD